VRHFTVDHHGGDRVDRIAEGDLIQYGTRTKRLGLVVTIRPVNSAKWPDRWRIDFEVIDEPIVGRRVHVLDTYAKGEGPMDRPCGHPACEGCTPEPVP
jgi:hypothetical protein